MIDSIDPEIERLARTVADDVAGEGSIEKIKVEEDYDFPGDQPVYRFIFLVDASRSSKPLGLLRIPLLQKLRDDLLARNDPHYPTIKLLDRADWERRQVA
jgi:hypothetical protein